MSGATVLMLVVAAIAIAAAARRYNLPSPLVLVVAGLALSFVPGHSATSSSTRTSCCSACCRRCCSTPRWTART